MFLFFLTGGLFLGWSLGSNDAANIFGTAVGSKMLRFRTAATIASIFIILEQWCRARNYRDIREAGTVDAIVVLSRLPSVRQSPFLHLTGINYPHQQPKPLWVQSLAEPVHRQPHRLLNSDHDLINMDCRVRYCALSFQPCCSY